MISYILSPTSSVVGAISSRLSNTYLILQWTLTSYNKSVAVGC